jgi:hypothetical protein
MQFLEKELETIIYDSFCDHDVYEKLQKKGLVIPLPYLFKRQLTIGNYGTSDLVTLERPTMVPVSIERFVFEPTVIRVWELKQNTINMESLLQVTRYMTGIKSWLTRAKIQGRKKYYYPSNIRIEGVLIGRTIDTHSDYLYLFNHFRSDDFEIFGDVRVFTYSYDYDGLSFNEENMSDYRLSKEGF